jgi:hypothetical protein
MWWWIGEERVVDPAHGVSSVSGISQNNRSLGSTKKKRQTGHKYPEYCTSYLSVR